MTCVETTNEAGGPRLDADALEQFWQFVHVGARLWNYRRLWNFCGACTCESRIWNVIWIESGPWLARPNLAKLHVDGVITPSNLASCTGGGSGGLPGDGGFFSARPGVKFV